MGIPWSDHAFIMYVVAACFYLFCTGMFIWWWLRSTSASSFYLAILLLLLGGVFRNIITLYGAALVINAPEEFIAFRSGILWPLRIYVEIGALVIITIIIVHRIKTRGYRKQETRDSIAQHSIENPLVSMQGLRKKALAALVIGRNAILEQEKYIEQIEAWLRGKDEAD